MLLVYSVHLHTSHLSTSTPNSTYTCSVLVSNDTIHCYDLVPTYTRISYAMLLTVNSSNSFNMQMIKMLWFTTLIIQLIFFTSFAFHLKLQPL